MPAIEWASGEVMEAPTWKRLLLDIGKTRWHYGRTEEELREILAKRAETWSGTVIDPDLPPRAFFEELQRAGLLRIGKRG